MLYEIRVKLGSVLSLILAEESYYCELIGLKMVCAYCPNLNKERDDKRNRTLSCRIAKRKLKR